MTNRRLEKIKEVTIRKPYVFYFIIIFLAYLGINMLVNKTYVTLPTLFTAYRISFVIPFIALSLITALLVGVNINLIILKFKEIKLLSGIGGTASLGLFGGILGGACPGCLVGLFPAFIGLFGVSATLSNLPLFGLEVQMASVGLLILSMFLLTKETACKIDLKK